MKEKIEITQQMMKLLIQIGFGIGFIFYISYYMSIKYFPDVSASELTNVLLIIAAIGTIFVGYFVTLLFISGMMLRDLKNSNVVFDVFITTESHSFSIFVPSAMIMFDTFLATYYFQSEIAFLIGTFLSSAPLIFILWKYGELSVFESFIIGLLYTLSNLLLPTIFAIQAKSFGSLATFVSIAFILLYTAIVTSATINFRLNTSSNKFIYFFALAVVPSTIIITSAFFDYGKQFVSIPFSIARYGHYKAIPMVIDENFTSKIGFKNDNNTTCLVKNSLGKEYYFSCNDNATEWIIPKDKIMMKPIVTKSSNSLFFE